MPTQTVRIIEFYGDPITFLFYKLIRLKPLKQQSNIKGKTLKV